MASDPTSAFPSAAPAVEPSKVLHLRNLPEECTDLDLKTIAEKCSHGEVMRVLLLSRKHQGFVEFKTFEDSARMLENCMRSPIRLGSRVLIAQYSNKPEISTPQRDPDVGDGSNGLGNLNGNGGNKVLLVTVTNVIYPVNVDCLFKVFKMQGNVHKIVTFTKQGKSQALVQFETPAEAASAMQRFNRQNIYSGCNQLNIQYSHLSDVTVNYNNDRTYDFTNPSLPPGDPQSLIIGAPIQGLSRAGGGGGALGGALGGYSAPIGGGSGAGRAGSGQLSSQLPIGMKVSSSTDHWQDPLRSGDGDNWGIDQQSSDPAGSWQGSEASYTSGAVSYGSPGRGVSAGVTLATPVLSHGGYGRGNGPYPSSHAPYAAQQGYGGNAIMSSIGLAGLPAGMHLGVMGGLPIHALHLGSPVILVNNLDPERAMPEPLFNLFSTCGTIQRIKILYNKRDSALIQFESPEMADNARRTLSGCPLWGRNIIISSSKHSSVQASRSDAEDEGAKLFSDYSSSTLHRYRNNNQRTIPSIEPSKLLHISNISPNIGEDEIRELFTPFGPVTKIKFISNTREGAPQSDRKMCLLELPTTQDAAEALCSIHGKSADGLRLRVSFSTSTLDGQR